MSWNPVGSTTATGVHSLSVQLSPRWLAREGERDQERDHSAQCTALDRVPSDKKSSMTKDEHWSRRADLNRGSRSCSAQRLPKTKGNLRVLSRFSRPNLVDVGLVLADNGSGLGTVLGTVPAWPPLPLCLCDGRRVLLRMHQHSSRERHEDDGEGDDRSIAHGHGLSSDDHDDAGVDSDPTAGAQREQWATSNGISLERSGPPASTPRPVRRGHSKLCSIGPRDCRILSTVGKRFSDNVICEGETHGFETT